jgi:hypothetical protein
LRDGLGCCQTSRSCTGRCTCFRASGGGGEPVEELEEPEERPSPDTTGLANKTDSGERGFFACMAAREACDHQKIKRSIVLSPHQKDAHDLVYFNV